MMGLKKKRQFPPLSENEKKLLEKVLQGTVEEVKALLQEKDVKVDCLDETGMTPLQHAAFRDKLAIAELLLAHGADVNSNEHENSYNALMFAALSGSTQMTRLMLQHGAKKDKINSVGRNAAQMAAFVGQHQCVAVINNFYSREDLEYYTVPQGLEKEPRLPAMVMPGLLTLLNMSNMHPVRICMHLEDHAVLMNESYKVCKVLDTICEKAMKARDTDDIMALKAHYFATVIRKAKDSKDLDTAIKALLRGREGDGHPEMQDKLIRQALKEFPYMESQLLQNMVRQLSTTKIGDDPTSLNILMQGVNGQKFNFDEENDCATCGEQKAARRCSACKMVHYCNPRCQKRQWFTHKKFCKQLAEEYRRLEKMKAETAQQEAEEKLKQAQIADTHNTENTKNGSEDQSKSGESVAEKKTEEKATEKETANLETDTNGACAGAGEKGLPGPPGSMPAGTPDINQLLQDPEILEAFKDPEVAKAFNEVSQNPANIAKYQSNQKVQDVIEKMATKFVGPVEAGSGDPGTGAEGASTAQAPPP